jgi:antitoxin ParD1/3/4
LAPHLNPPKQLEEREVRVAALRAAMVEGEISGAAEPFDFDAFVAELRADDTMA